MSINRLCILNSYSNIVKIYCFNERTNSNFCFGMRIRCLLARVQFFLSGPHVVPFVCALKQNMVHSLVYTARCAHRFLSLVRTLYVLLRQPMPSQNSTYLLSEHNFGSQSIMDCGKEFSVCRIYLAQFPISLPIVPRILSVFLIYCAFLNPIELVPCASTAAISLPSILAWALLQKFLPTFPCL